MPILFKINSVVLADGMGEVGEEGDVQLAQASFCPGGGHPGQVGEVWVNWASHHLKSVTVQ